MRNLILELNSLEMTEHVARKMAEHLFQGTIMLFWGEMGSGKTTFIKSLCSGLGVLPEKVTSPTYTLVNIYKSSLFIFHVDLFRLTSQEQLYDMDRADLIADDGITMVEWPQMLQNYLTDEPILNLSFTTISDHHRRLKLETQTSEFDILLDMMEQLILSKS
tara:strand:- start:1642 stop:2127 length:486 start_codon:yes stop_codon:yes gene_type:complete